MIPGYVSAFIIVVGLLGIEHMITKWKNGIEGAPTNRTDVLSSLHHGAPVRDPAQPTLSLIEKGFKAFGMGRGAKK